MRNWKEIVESCDLKNWREALAAVMTYAKPDEFSALCGKKKEFYITYMAWYIVSKISDRFYLESFVNLLLITDKKMKFSFECFSQKYWLHCFSIPSSHFLKYYLMILISHRPNWDSCICCLLTVWTRKNSFLSLSLFICKMAHNQLSC